jgi:hypothetical protein
MRGVIESKHRLMIIGLLATLVVREEENRQALILAGHQALILVGHQALILVGHRAPLGVDHLRLLNTLEANTARSVDDDVFRLGIGYLVACGAE